MTRLPAPPAEVPVQRSLDGLAPQFRAAVERVVARMRNDGHLPTVFETLRTEQRQSFIYGFGREYDDGRGIVTHSESAVDTWHGYGLAVDIICGVRLWGARPDFWASLGTACRAEGLVWGADWNNNGRTDDERFVDRPHVQWGNGMRRSPSSRAVKLQADGGNEAVWQAVGAA
ncbi:MAG: M15 family metallopeptidase [Gemmatimonas sp.]|nr:M15 family metallopeptidase [Gemmatimonas sp.]